LTAAELATAQCIICGSAEFGSVSEKAEHTSFVSIIHHVQHGAIQQPPSFVSNARQSRSISSLISIIQFYAVCLGSLDILFRTHSVPIAKNNEITFKLPSNP
jgi:hypothetical protein